MSLITRKKLLGFNVESTKGTLNAPSDAEAANFYEIECNNDDWFSDGERQPQGHYFGSVDSQLGPQTGTLTFRMELTHPGAGNQPGVFLKLLQGAGYAISDSDADTEEDTATPVSDLGSTQSALTFYCWENGRVKKLRGCAGTFTVDGEYGKRIFVNFTFNGVWEAPADASMPARAPIQTKGMRAVSMVLTFGGASLPKMSRFSYDQGNTVSPHEDVTDSNGVKYYSVTERAPRVTLDPEAELVATHDAYGGLLACTTGALIMTFTDGTNTITMTGARAQRINVQNEDRGNKLIDGITLALHNSSGNDDAIWTEST